MRTAGSQLLHRRRRITDLGVDSRIRTQLPCQGQLAVVDVDRADLQTHVLRILDAQMAEAADTGDSDPFAGLGLRLLDPLVAGHAGTDDGRCCLGGQRCRNVRDIVGVGQQILGEGAVGVVAREGFGRADGLPRRETVFTVSARGMQPGHTHPVTLLDGGHARPHRAHPADALVSGYEGQRGLDRPVAARRMDVRVAHSARFGLDQDLPGPGGGDLPFTQHHRLLELLDHRHLHLRHTSTPVVQVQAAAAGAPKPRTASVMATQTAAASPYTMDVSSA